MELKEMILSTLAELEDETKTPAVEPKKETPALVQEEVVQTPVMAAEERDDVRFLKNLRERILVLFEGFQAPNNQNIEAKVDLTLNFLEYLLASIEEQLEKAQPTKQGK